VVRGRKRSTLERYVYTIRLVYTAAGLPVPTQALARRRTADGRPDNDNASRQAGELGAVDIDLVLASLGTAPRDQRDAALLCLASDVNTLEDDSHL
jgi:hypothetical protein